MDLTTPEAVREFLALCLDPGHGIKRTPATLAKVMPGPLGAAVDQFAPHLAELRKAAEEADQQARAARKLYTDGLAAWITSGETPEPAVDLGQCPQNRIGTFIYVTDPVQLGQHFYREDEAGGHRCVYCDVPAHWGGEPLVEPTVRPYVYNSRSVNRTVKHAVNPFDERMAVCTGAYMATEPMPAEEAARLPLCGGCRRVLTGKSGDED